MASDAIDPAEYRRRREKPKQPAVSAVVAAVPVMMPMLMSTDIRA